MNFCSNCGSDRIAQGTPANDNRLRWICPACERIFYDNPNVIVGTIPVWEGKVLLCRRAIQPRLGLWTLPAGFLENAESVEEGAVRETFEESGAKVKVVALHTLFNVPQVNQVYMLFLAEIAAPEFPFGPETSEIMLASPDEIPWDEMAFQSVRFALERWCEDPGTAPLPHLTTHPDGRK